VAIGAIVGLLAALGGFAEATTRALPRVALAERVEGDEVVASVASIYLTPVAPTDTASSEDGIVYIVAEANIENSTTRAHHFVSEVIRVDVEGLVTPSIEPTFVIDARSGKPVGAVQPGLPLTVLFVWAVATTEVEAGGEILIGFFERREIADDPIFDDARSAPAAIAVVEATLDERLPAQQGPAAQEPASQEPANRDSP